MRRNFFLQNYLKMQRNILATKHTLRHLKAVLKFHVTPRLSAAETQTRLLFDRQNLSNGANTNKASEFHIDW